MELYSSLSVQTSFSYCLSKSHFLCSLSRRINQYTNFLPNSFAPALRQFSRSSQSFSTFLHLFLFSLPLPNFDSLHTVVSHSRDFTNGWTRIWRTWWDFQDRSGTSSHIPNQHHRHGCQPYFRDGIAKFQAIRRRGWHSKCGMSCFILMHDLLLIPPARHVYLWSIVSLPLFSSSTTLFRS